MSITTDTTPPPDPPNRPTLRTVYRALQALAGRTTTRVTRNELVHATRLDAAEVEAAMDRFERAAPSKVRPSGSQPPGWTVSL